MRQPPEREEIDGPPSCGIAVWSAMTYRSRAQLDAGLADVVHSPLDQGRLALIVRRPASGVREVLAEAVLDPTLGLVGDNWSVRPSSQTPDRSPHPDMQLNVMNARVAALVAGPPTPLGDKTAGDRAVGVYAVGNGPMADHLPIDRRTLAGDQLYLDLDLSEANLPAGTRLYLGSAIIEVTAQPHTGCGKFSARYGVDALRFVNSTSGRRLRLRGLNARVIVGGTVRVGDVVAKVG